ncbi:hypothetical protein MWH28_02855 [Natroniella sulfidigena]|uniref:hypothetical protein n=1 Tax=Natroniella sulfidigena TaxID=723921 RepID=UPI00200B6511|nr:hypothetical protein [Natroniella sulfidigena]MCK8816302.1 hypothetical protein [Natroniella sulfidigena]
MEGIDILYIVKALFIKFNKNNILYCHWKSNEHLEPGLNGKTDLDILIARESFAEVNQILLELGYKRCKTLDYLDYYSVEDFVGFDQKTGKLVHIHLHYELVIGKKFIKGYHLPLEKEILDTRILDKKNNVYIISPNYEIVLLIIRRALKCSFFDRIKFWQGVFPKGEKKEFLWLLERVNLDKVAQIAEEIINKEFSSLLIDFIDSGSKFNKISKKVKKGFDKYSLYSSLNRYLTYHIRKFKIGVNYIRSKFLRHPIPYKRGLKEGGVVVAFFGVDGAGKSTMLSKIKNWISWKFDSQQIYFGSGDGRSSLLRLPLKLIAKLRSNIKGNSVNRSKKEDKEKKKSLLIRFMKILWALTLALEKKKKIKKMWRARTRGMVVLCDRYPQAQFYGFNDGPLLRDWADSKIALKRKISDWEYSIYKLSEEFTPDIAIKLKIPAEIAIERKKDTPLYRIKEKINVIENLKFNQKTKVCDVDSSRSIEETVLEIKNIIWGNQYEE